MRRTERVDEIEEQTSRLAERGITLEIWAREDISQQLRTQSQLVFEFFGPAWVERFCGRAELAALHHSRIRLTPEEIAGLRRRLRALYSNVFATNDPGLNIAQQDSPLPLYERYVTPDLFSEWGRVDTGASDRQESLNGDQGEPARDDVFASLDMPEGRRHGRPRYRSPAVRRMSTQRSRTTIDAFFAGDPAARYVILGGPGSGKSALLRFLTLDLLSDEPRASGLARLWGGYLPIWIPFGGWVDQMRQEQRPVPLSGMLRTLVALWDEEALWPLVEEALEDSRLLLLVDGLDEWSSEESARIALSQLNVFAAQRQLPIILTSRPHGFQRLADEFPGWKKAELAPLTPQQQLALATSWFAKWLGADIDHTARGEQNALERTRLRAAQLAEEFVADVRKQTDLGELSGTPLLLSILILLKYQNATLPEHRYRAYELLAEQLISLWPRRRRAAALIRETGYTGLRDEEREQAYAYLAYKVHMETPSGVFDQNRARTHIEDYLKDDVFGPGFPPADANRISREVLDVGESESGILVKRSPREIGFYHRALQEYLAARHIATQGLDLQLQHVRERATNVLWRDVLLCLLWLTRSQAAVGEIIRALETVLRESEPPESFHLRELLTEIATGPFACPTVVARELVRQASDEIRRGWWMPHRERLLGATLSGLRTARLRSYLLPVVRQWFPARVEYRSDLLTGISKWEDVEMVRQILWPNLLFDESPGVQLTAAELIANRWSQDPSVQAELLTLAKSPVHPRTRAATLLAHTIGWESVASFEEVLNREGNEQVPELLYVQLRSATKDGHRGQVQAEQLLKCLTVLHGVHYTWHPLVKATLQQWFPRDEYVRDLCLSRVRSDTPRNAVAAGLSHNVAWDILLEGYPHDDAVVDAIIEDLRRPHPLFRSIDWSILALNFQDHPALVEALDTWMLSDPQYQEPAVAGAALVGRTDVGKRALLQRLDTSIPFWVADALIKGWGLGDHEVRDALMRKAFASNKEASLIARELPRIISDPEQSYHRLLELLRDPVAKRPGFAIAGLHALGRITDNPEVVAVVLERVTREGVTDNNWAMVAQTIVDAPAVPGVYDLAVAQLRNPDGPHVAVAHSFGSDPAVRARLLEMVAPLPGDLRFLIAEAIRDTRVHDAEITRVCEDHAWDSNPEIAAAGAIAYYRRLSREGPIPEEEIERLRQGIVAYGPTYEGKRQVALAGILEIDRIEIFEEARESIGEAIPVHVSLKDMWGPNPVLIELLVERWNSLHQRYGDETLQRFSSGFSARPPMLEEEVWDLVAPYVDEQPSLVSSLLAFAELNSTSETMPEVLLFLARHRSGSLLLRERCLGAVSETTDDWDRNTRIWETAADILATQFSHDVELWNELERRVAEGARGGRLVALTRGRPSSSVLEQLLASADEDRRLSEHQWLRLVFAAGRTEGLIQRITTNLASPPPEIQDSLRWLFRPLRERVARDAQFAAALRSAAEEGGSKTLQATLLSVLLRVPGLIAQPELRSLLREQLTEAPGILLAFDLRLARVRSSAHILMDASDVRAI